MSRVLNWQCRIGKAQAHCLYVLAEIQNGYSKWENKTLVTGPSTPHLRPASATLQLGKVIIMKHRHINLQAQILCDPEHSQLEGEKERSMDPPPVSQMDQWNSGLALPHEL